MAFRLDPTGPLASAAPATRWVLRGTLGSIVAAGLLCILALIPQAATSIGVHSHPPAWLRALSYVASAGVALGAVYAILYLRTELRWSKRVPGALLVAFFAHYTTMHAIGWAVPTLTIFVSGKPVTVEVPVVRTWGSWRHGERAQFAPSYGGGGSISVGWPASSLLGTTLVMEGQGNAWATRITRVLEVRVQ